MHSASYSTATLTKLRLLSAPYIFISPTADAVNANPPFLQTTLTTVTLKTTPLKPNPEPENCKEGMLKL